MIKKILVVICLWQLLVQNANCQNKSKYKILLGSEFGFHYANLVNQNRSSKASYLTVLSLEPKVGLSISNKIFVGLQGGRTFYWSNFIDLPIIQHFGAFGTYKWRDFSDKIEIGKFNVDLNGNLRFNLNYRVSNYGPDAKKNFDSFGNHFVIHMLIPSIRANLILYKSLVLEFGLGIPIYYNSKEKILLPSKIVPMIGIFYIFNEHK